METYIILSTEPWGKMLLSKMHYAIELASMGHKVYFINPPLPNRSKDIASINFDIQIDNITIINLKPVKGSLFFRHKIPFIFNKISSRYVKHILELIPQKITEVWCFNPHMFINLSKFNAQKKLLFLYDFYKGKYIFNVAETADALISVSQIILDHYDGINVPRLLLQHGLSKHFADIAEDRIKEQKFDVTDNSKIKVGYVGNLLREGIDTIVTRKIIEEHPEKEFHFWGPYSFENNNVAGNNIVIPNEFLKFIEFLKAQKNVFLRGVKKQETLAAEINEMDCFLFLYSKYKDLNKASNSHKILEYLSTGKTVISTFVSNYKDTDLLNMCNSTNDEDLALLFTTITSKLEDYNNSEKQQKRISFALDNTYIKQLKRIHNFVG